MSDGLTYRDAGVDIAAADAFVERISALARGTHDGRVVSHTGAYAGLVAPDLEGLSQPLLAASCDGVGTKLLVARQAGSYAGLGQDLVAMQVNDLLPSGARPLLFMDYIATGKLDPNAMSAVVAGAADACKEAGCVLLGGETAEMPGVYAPGDFDLAGFAVGIVDRARLPDPESIAVGDAVLGLPSSGLHSNGYSLARKALLERGGLNLDGTPEGLEVTLAEALLEPTRIYVRDVLALMEDHPVKAGAHVTGGGLLGRGEKLARPGRRLEIDPGTYPRPGIIELVAKAGDVAPTEMARTFNMGLGYLVVVAPEVAENVGAPWLKVGRIKDGEAGIELGYANS